MLPALILLAIFTYYPVAKLLQLSFTDWNLLKPTWNYVGFKNWKWLESDVADLSARFAREAKAEREQTTLEDWFI